MGGCRGPHVKWLAITPTNQLYHLHPQAPLLLFIMEVSNRVMLFPEFMTVTTTDGTRDGVHHSVIGHEDAGSTPGLNTEEAVYKKVKVHHPQDFELPKAVKSKVDAEVQQASAFSVTTALYAGVLLSLVQLEVDQPSSAAWEALRFFTYSAITVNLTGTALALVIIKLCSDLELSALRLAITDSSSLPARIMQGSKIPKDLLLSQYELLEQFGMPLGYRLLDFGVSIWFMTGNVFNLTAVTMWVWLAEKRILAGTTMIITGPAVLGLLYAIAMTRSPRRKTVYA